MMEYDVMKLETAIRLMGLYPKSVYEAVNMITKKYLEQVQYFHRAIYNGNFSVNNFPYKNEKELNKNVYRYDLGNGQSLGFHDILELNRSKDNEKVVSPVGVEILQILYYRNFVHTCSFAFDKDLGKVKAFKAKGYNYENYAQHNGIAPK